MNFRLLHPADQIVLMMNRIYQGGMTTTSGGNISILEDNGDIWITPSGIDKGSLTRNDMCRVSPDGKTFGLHKPSVELPFHAKIYKSRPDIRAVLHTHPPALVAFSLARVLPQTRLVANAYHTLDTITMAAYAVPGSQELGDNIAAEFKKGFSIVVMENHGVVVGGEDLSQAFMKFETLEATANLEILARKLGTPKTMMESEIFISLNAVNTDMGEFKPDRHSAEESAARRDMITFIHRAYRQKLFSSTQGTYSVRLSDGSFIITPYGLDRAYMNESDLVLIKNGMRESGKIPPRCVDFHKLIYDKHPNIRSVLGANPPHVMAFAVTDTALDTRTIPESYAVLRDVQKIPFDFIYLKQEEYANMFSPKTPVLICENNQILATGDSLLSAFDRLEVAEATARSIIAAQDIGPIVRISDESIEDIDAAFNLT